MQNTIYPCLTVKGHMQEAVTFYTETFSDSKLVTTNPFASLITLSGQNFLILNDGPTSKPNASISFMVILNSEAEIERIWEAMLPEGEVLMALDSYDWSKKYGWIADKFGVTWQLYLGDENSGQRFSPTLMFTGERTGRAAEAVHLYTSIFPQSKITGILNYSEADGDRTDLVKHAQFVINDYVMMAMDSSGAHGFSFNDAISLVVACEDQQEIDSYWDRLTANGGYEVACGWLTDPFGICWQIVPKQLGRLMTDPNRGPQVLEAMMKMKKLVIADLENA